MATDGCRSGVHRRTFLVGTALASVGLASGTASAATVERGTVRARRTLGKTGLEVPDIAFGSFRLAEGDEDLVRYAVDAGITHFDTADSYGGGASERTLGRALAGRRDKCTITSKTVTAPTGTRAEFMKGLEESLGRLRTDRIDIYLNH